MSNAKLSFEKSIQDAELIVKYFDELNSIKENKKSKELEVLKRAGLIIALTAWETYVEDRIEEAVQALLKASPTSQTAKFMEFKLEDELKRFHNPNSDKTKKLFLDYLGIDVYESWSWNNFDLSKIKKTLDDLVSKRGEAAHRARIEAVGKNNPDLITIDELRKSFTFLKNLVEATDKALSRT
jgi:hypothetical protein